MFRLHTKTAPLALLAVACAFFSTAYAQEGHLTGNKEEALTGITALGKTFKAQQLELSGKKDEATKLRQEAIADYDFYLTKNPTDMEIVNKRAALKELVQKDSGKADYEQVIATTSKKIEASAGDHISLGQRADAYAGMKMYDKAKSDYNTAITLSTGDDNRRYTTKLGIMELDAKAK